MARRPRFRSFRTRLLALWIGLIAAAQVATLAAVLAATRRNVAQQERAELLVGGRVFQQLLLARELQLLDSVEILTADFAFREAVATQDRATIHSVLENHGERVGASFVVLLGLDARVLAASGERAGWVTPAPDALAPAPLPELIVRAESEGQAAAATIFAGAPCQLIVVPIEAPLRIAWVGMGFPIDDALARDFERLTTLDVSFWGARAGAERALLASTLDGDARAHLAAALAARGGLGDAEEPFLLGATDHLSLRVRLDDDPAHPLDAVLQSSMSVALAPWRALRTQLLGLAALTLALSVLVALVLGRSVTHPVQILVAAARRILGGSYETPVQVTSRDELGLLAATFNEMQRGIAERERRIVEQAQHDPLTGLPNRALAHARVSEALTRVRRDGRGLALLAIDLDGFKAVNDGFGYATGDQVLCAFAARLQARCTGAAVAARLGNDEFLVVLEGVAAAEAAATARALVTALRAPIVVEEARIELPLRVGVAAFPEHGDAPAVLLRRADIALQDAKTARSEIVVYEPGRDERHLRQLALVRDLRVAIAQGAFELHYQPKLEIATREVSQAEALLRWTHPERGPIRPDEVIALAERWGLIGDLTRWVLAEVIRQWRVWNDSGLRLALAVNLSALDLSRPELPRLVAELLAAHAMPPGALILEITESAVMEDPRTAIAVLEGLRASGVKLAIDDFGTGQSSLAQLKRMPVDELKIDKSFVSKLENESDDAAIVRSIIDLGHHLGLSVVAEGVENAQAWDFLARSRCDLIQGYALSRPLAPAAFETWLRAHHGEAE